jgi:hypothetical protein
MQQTADGAARHFRRDVELARHQRRIARWRGGNRLDLVGIRADDESAAVADGHVHAAVFPPDGTDTG